MSEEHDLGVSASPPGSREPSPSVSAADASDDRDPYWEYDYHECWNCGGEGFTYGCSWDWQCATYDGGEGTCLCTRRCDWCNPAPATPEVQQLRKILADALKDGRP